MTAGGVRSPAARISSAMTSCSSGLASRPHGRGRCGATQPPAAKRSALSALGSPAIAASSALICARQRVGLLRQLDLERPAHSRGGQPGDLPAPSRPADPSRARSDSARR